MDKRHRLSVSFKHEYRHIYDHLQGIPNKSDYVAKAVEAYMHVNQSSISQKEIRAIVIEILQEQENVPQTMNKLLSSQMDQLTQEDTELINELF